jgi:hypothetical protein
MHAMVVIPRQRARCIGRERSAVAAVSFDPRIPSSFVGLVSLPATLSMAVISVALNERGSDPTPLVTMAVLVGGIAWWCRPAASLVPAGLGWLALNGFVVNSFGQLNWHGDADAVRLGCIVLVALAASSARAGAIRFSARQIVTEPAPAGQGTYSGGCHA